MSAISVNVRGTGQPSGATNTRRRDIQGLRTIAVLAVVAFHAGLPVPGGFVGVDVFFVISGFVITGMLHRQWARAGLLPLRQFYWRRFRRLAPALALMVSVTIVLSSLLLSPFGPQRIVETTALGALMLSANIVIAKTTGGYFDAAASDNPLLNTWSLSVEEQFYLAFPLILATGWWLAARHRRYRHSTAYLVSLVAIGSFGLAMVGSHVGVGPRSDWLIGFYGTFGRAWEFAVGALVALLMARMTVIPMWLTNAIGGLGIVLVALSLFSMNGTTPFPSEYTLLPVTGTALLLIAGLQTTSALSKLLGSSPMVWLGDRSYSIYLWHWPLIVFAIVLFPLAPLAPLISLPVSFGIAFAAYRYVEQPIRQRSDSSKEARLRLVALAAVLPVALAACLLMLTTAVIAPRFIAGDISEVNSGDIGEEDFTAFFSAHSFPCPMELAEYVTTSPGGTPTCVQSSPESAPQIALVGDSHASQYFPAFAEALPGNNIMFFDSLGVPIAQSESSSWIFNYLEKTPSIKTVVLSAFWQSRGVPQNDLQTTVSELERAGKAVFILDDTPLFPFEPFGCKYPRALLLPSTCTADVSYFEAAKAAASTALDQVAGTARKAEVVDLSHYVCGVKFCSMARDGMLLFRDSHHLNINGSRFMTQALLADRPAIAGGG